MSFRIVILPPKMRARARRWLVPALWVIAGGGLVLFVFAFSFYLAMRVEMRSTEVQVPDLSDLDLDAAHRLAVPSGRILQQMPPAGASVRRGRKIKLILSLGGKVLEVPDLYGQASRAVEIELRQTGFMPGDEARIHHRDASAGLVIAQVPPAQTPAVPSTRVHRLVSAGPELATWVMPDLSGLSRADAERWLATAGFRRGAVRSVTMRGRSSGSVVGQLPLPGYPVRSNEVVELSVAR
jgi:serine/threonine-protein kinase